LTAPPMGEMGMGLNLASREAGAEGGKTKAIISQARIEIAVFGRRLRIVVWRAPRKITIWTMILSSDEGGW
jgi:hypothetical protein